MKSRCNSLTGEISKLESRLEHASEIKESCTRRKIGQESLMVKFCDNGTKKKMKCGRLSYKLCHKVYKYHRSGC